MDISMADGKQNTGHRAFIVALLMMPQGQLVMADNSNKTVKVTDSSYPVVSHDVKLVAAPLDMTQVNVDYVAVTTTTTYLYMVRVTGTPEVVSRVPQSGNTLVWRRARTKRWRSVAVRSHAASIL